MLKASLWFAARMVVSVGRPFTDMATAFVAMATYVEDTDIAGAIDVGNLEGASAPFLASNH
jgi:hypothetical protein